jgi:DNA-directed RNA polymerase subunit F
LRLILRRVRQRRFVIEHLRKIVAIDSTAARRTADEVLGLVPRRIAKRLADVLTARDHHFLPPRL